MLAIACYAQASIQEKYNKQLLAHYPTIWQNKDGGSQNDFGYLVLGFVWKFTDLLLSHDSLSF